VTVSTHYYAALLPGFNAVAIREGVLSCDASRAPHVEAEITVPLPGEWDTTTVTSPLTGDPVDVPVWTPTPEVLETVDPRETPRLVLMAQKDNEAPYAWDLGVRERTINRRDATVTLKLASDEALLSDYAPLADVLYTVSLASSLRTLVGYVLDAAIPGATLEATPATDADMTPYWSVANLVKNPSAETNTTFWSNGQNGTGITRVSTAGYATSGSYCFRITAAAAGTAWLDYDGSMSVTPGRTYSVACDMRLGAGDPAKTGTTMVRFYDRNGNRIQDQSYVGAPLSTTWQRQYNRVTAPANATQATLHFGLNSAESGQNLHVDSVMFYEGIFATEYFDGGSVRTGYVCAWDGDGHASASTRTPDPVERDPESVYWKAGQNALEFLHPLVQAAGLRLVCDGARAWTLRDAEYVAPGTVSLTEGVNLITAEETISRDAGLWYDARVTRYTWTDRNGIQQERVDAYALNTPYTRLTTLELQSAYPGPGRSQYAVQRAQGVGREVTVSTVSDYAVVAEQPMLVTLGDAPVQLGTVRSVEFDLSTDEMTITTRTVDTPAGAINLLSGTIDALTGTINDLS